MTVQTCALLGLAAIAVLFVLRKLGRIESLLVLVVLGIAVGAYLFVGSYNMFGGNSVQVATIQAIALTNQPHEMVVRLTTNGATKTYQLDGDRVELNADVVAFQPWLNQFGIHNGFQLSRLTSQYDDGAAHLVKPIVLHNTGFTFSIPFLERSHYRNGVIIPNDSVTYAIYVTVQGDMYAVHS
jgi:energy-coupling factor transporter transmembrane protein EcfT